jgi:hypothetical protein
MSSANPYLGGINASTLSSLGEDERRISLGIVYMSKKINLAVGIYRKPFLS